MVLIITTVDNVYRVNSFRTIDNAREGMLILQTDDDLYLVLQNGPNYEIRVFCESHKEQVVSMMNDDMHNIIPFHISDIIAWQLYFNPENKLGQDFSQNIPFRGIDDYKNYLYNAVK
jgi:hypothetical protein